MIHVGEISYEYKTNKSMFSDMGTTNEVNSLVWLRIKEKFQDECTMDGARVIKPTITETTVDGMYLIKGVSEIVLEDDDNHREFE